MDYGENTIGLYMKSNYSGTYCGGARVYKIMDTNSLDSKEYNTRIFEYKAPQSNIGSGEIGIKHRYSMYETWSRNGVCFTQTDVSCNSLGRNENMAEYHIGYSDVVERFPDNSYIHYHYSSNMNFPNNMTGNTHSLQPGSYRASSQSPELIRLLKSDLYRTNDLSHYRGKIEEKTYYDSQGIQKQQEKYTYYINDLYNRFNVSLASLPRGMCTYKIYLNPCLLMKKEVIDSNNNTMTENYKYNPYNFISEKSVTNSDGTNYITKYVYRIGFSYGSPGFQALSNKNMINKPFRITKYIQNESYATPMVVEDVIFDYKILANDIPVVDKVKELRTFSPVLENYDEFNNNFIVKESYENYDSYGNPTYIVKDDNTKTVYIWGYSGQQLIAQITNTTYEQVLAEARRLNLNLDNLLSDIELSTANENKVNSLRDLIPQAQVTTYTYSPWAGIKSITDPRGFTTHYTYDTFGRLKESHFLNSSNNKCIIENYKYSYINK